MALCVYNKNYAQLFKFLEKLTGFLSNSLFFCNVR